MAGEEDPEDVFAGLPGDVGDDREKYVRVTLPSGDSIEHGDVYFRYTADEFFVASSMAFEEEETTRYRKGEVVRVEIHQHHPACFITSAVAQDEDLLATLRWFRDTVLGRSHVGRGLISVYYAVSPPIARTLEEHPGTRTARAVRWLIERCGGLVASRDAVPLLRRPIFAVVTLLYILGLLIALTGTTLIRVKTVLLCRKTGPSSAGG